jgi:ATP-dependent 26S proteasome regulatory subunit
VRHFVKLSEDLDAAYLRNVVTDGAVFAIREDRDYIAQDDLIKAVRKIGEAKNLSRGQARVQGVLDPDRITFRKKKG